MQTARRQSVGSSRRLVGFPDGPIVRVRLGSGLAMKGNHAHVPQRLRHLQDRHRPVFVPHDGAHDRRGPVPRVAAHGTARARGGRGLPRELFPARVSGLHWQGTCHRPGGDASNTNFHAYWELDFDSNQNAHGVCQKPISFGGGSLSWIIYPGNADESIMIQRMAATDGGDRMPPLGRDLVHGEGLELVKAWINSLADNPACH